MSARRERQKTQPDGGSATASMRLDKWLWCARFYKTRSVAADEIDRGRVQVNGQAAKPARELRLGDTVALRRNHTPCTVVVRAFAAMRGPASVASALYEETQESIALRGHLAESRLLAPEPAAAIRSGRPGKRDRRELERVRGQWDDRWSAEIN